jgi:glycine oxidase
MVARRARPETKAMAASDTDSRTDTADRKVVPLRRSRAAGPEDGLDAVVVGGGVIGLACAWRAAQRGLRVRVLERDVPGAGASHVAAGMLAPVGELEFGEAELLEMTRAAAETYPAFVAELEGESRTDVSYRADGALHVALDRDEAAQLRRRHRLQRSMGLEAEWLAPRECRRLEPGLLPSIAGGVFAPAEASVDPQALLEALVLALRERGAELIEGSEVAELLVEGGRVAGVRLADDRRVGCRTVVVATGAWSGSGEWLPEEARPSVRPVKGQVLELRGPAETPVCERIVASELVYVVPRPDGRLMVGATVEERGFDRSVTAGGVLELLREAYRLLPDLAELELLAARASLRPGTPDNLPLVGPGEVEGLVLALAGERVAALLGESAVGAQR